MKKWTKLFFIVIAGLVALVVALVVLANVLITPERVKNALLPIAQDNLNRKLELGDIAVSLFSGIEIHGLTVYEQDGTEIFVSADSVRLKYQLLPLLTLKVVIDEVRLEKPTIRVVRLRDGQYNFSDLMGSASARRGQPGSAANEQVADSQDQVAISLLISNVLIQDGQLTFFDHVLNDKAPYRYEMSSLQISAKGVSLTGKVPLSMQCQINGSSLTVDGHVNLLPLGADLNVALNNLDVVAFKPYLEEAVPGRLEGLKLNLKSTLSATPDEISLRGSLSFLEIYLLLDAMPDVPVENARLDADYDLLLSNSAERLKLNHLKLDYNGIKVDMTGEVKSLMSDPDLAMTVVVPPLEIRNFISAVPRGLINDVSSLDPAGVISAEANLSGRLDEPLALLKSAKVDLDSVQATAAGQRPAFSGRLLIEGEQLSSESLRLRLGDNHADINLKIQKLLSPPLVVLADISSDRFLLEPLLAGSAGAAVSTDQEERAARGGQPTEEMGPFAIPLDMTGSISVREAVWKDLVINDFLAQYTLKENVFKLSRMGGQVAGGQFGSSGHVDLRKKGLAYTFNIDLEKIQADPLLTALAPKSAGSLLGDMTLKMEVEGRGTRWQTLNRNLSGNGNLLVKDGRLTNPALLNGLKTFLQLPELNELPFNDFKGQFKVVDGKVQLDSQMLSSLIKLFPKGTVGLNGELNLGLDTRLSPELTAKLDRKGGTLSYLADQDGWTQVPLLIKGTLDSPSFNIDPKGAQAQATKALNKELGRQIDKIFKQPESTVQENGSQQPGDGSGTEEDPARKLLQDSLQKLFGH